MVQSSYSRGHAGCHGVPNQASKKKRSDDQIEMWVRFCDVLKYNEIGLNDTGHLYVISKGLSLISRVLNAFDVHLSIKSGFSTLHRHCWL